MAILIEQSSKRAGLLDARNRPGGPQINRIGSESRVDKWGVTYRPYLGQGHEERAELERVVGASRVVIHLQLMSSFVVDYMSALHIMTSQYVPCRGRHQLQQPVSRIGVLANETLIIADRHTRQSFMKYELGFLSASRHSRKHRFVLKNSFFSHAFVNYSTQLCGRPQGAGLLVYSRNSGAFFYIGIKTKTVIVHSFINPRRCT